MKSSTYSSSAQTRETNATGTNAVEENFSKEPAFNDADLLRYSQDQSLFPSSKLHSRSVSHVAVNFISSCMEPIPQKRTTAEAGMKHEWIKHQLSTGLTQPSAITTNETPFTGDSAPENYLSWLTQPVLHAQQMHIRPPSGYQLPANRPFVPTPK